MVAAAYHRLHADVFGRAKEIEQKALVPWLMAFLSRRPLSMHHPRIGAISFSGLPFSGSPVDVYDSFVLLSVLDFTEEQVRAAEAALEDVPEEKLDQSIGEFAGIIFSAATRLSDRAAQFRARMLKSDDNGNACSAPPSRIAYSALTERLRLKVEDIRLLRRNAAERSINLAVVGVNSGLLQVGSVASVQQMHSSGGDHD
jgi:hypothetical protein